MMTLPGTAKARFFLLTVLTWLLLAMGAARAGENSGPASAIQAAVQYSADEAAKDVKAISERAQWMLPVAPDQRMIHIPRSSGGDKSITFLAEPFAPVVAPSDGVMIYKGPLNASETGVVLAHPDGAYSVISSPFEWESSHFQPLPGLAVTRGQFLVNARGGASVRIPVSWRLFRGVDERLRGVLDLDTFIGSVEARQLGFQNRAQALERIFAAQEVNTKQLMNLGAVQIDFGADISREDEFSVKLDKTEIALVDQIFNAQLLPSGAYEIEVTSGRFFKSTKKNTVFVTSTGTSRQWLQRARNGDVMAAMADFIPGPVDAPLRLADSNPAPERGESTKQSEQSELDRLAEEERAREQERLAQASAEKERLRVAEVARVQAQERLAQEARTREIERLAEVAKGQEQERLVQLAKAKEQERLAQLAAEKEKLRAAEEARFKEQERLAQAAKAREGERLAELAKAKEQERLAQAARAKEQERLAQAAKLKEQEQAQAQAQARLAQEERARNEALLGARQRDEELVKLRQQLAKLEDEKVSKDQQTVYATRRALVIGNDSYRQVTQLVNAREDARAIAASLQQVGYQVTLKLDLTEKDMKAALRTFKGQVEGGDEVLVFFAGHGVQLGAANYLLPVDIAGESEEQIRDESIQLQRVLDDMSEKKAKFTLAMIDACRDNPFRTASRNIGGRGLAPTTAATGQMVIFSAGAGQQALDKLGPADKNRNGLFTRIFLKEMQKPGVSIDKVVRNVRNEVVGMAKSVGHEQVPAIYDQVVGEFYFRR